MPGSLGTNYLGNAILGLRRISRPIYKAGRSYMDKAMASSIAKSPITRWGVGGTLGLMGLNSIMNNASDPNRSWIGTKGLSMAGAIAGGAYGASFGGSLGLAGRIAGGAVGAMTGGFVGHHPMMAGLAGTAYMAGTGNLMRRPHLGGVRMR